MGLPIDVSGLCPSLANDSSNLVLNNPWNQQVSISETPLLFVYYSAKDIESLGNPEEASRQGAGVCLSHDRGAVPWHCSFSELQQNTPYRSTLTPPKSQIQSLTFDVFHALCAVCSERRSRTEPKGIWALNESCRAMVSLQDLLFSAVSQALFVMCYSLFPKINKIANYF